MLVDPPSRPADAPGDEPRPSGHRAATGTVTSALVRAGRATVLTCFTTVALAGAVATPPVLMLVAAPLVGLLAAGLVAAVAGSLAQDRWSGRRAAVFVGVGAAGTVPFGFGLAVLGHSAGPLVTAMFVSGTLLAERELTAWVARDTDAADDLAVLGRRLSHLPTDDLLQIWRAAGAAPGDDAPARARTAEIRALLLDELSRRDPAGVARWLREGGAPPERFIRTDHDLAG